MAALIGYTGFVGSTLMAADPGAYTDLFNSKNFRAAADRQFDHLVCAGVDARKWLANREPEADLARITELLDILETTRARRVTLVSTVDVYGAPGVGGREVDVPSPTHAYGKNRLHVEEWFSRRIGYNFDDVRILRLPALFGKGLKKNAIYDLIHHNDVEKIDPRGVFQFYDMSGLAADIEATWRAKAIVRNMVTPPLRVADLVDRFFPEQKDRVGSAVPAEASPAIYDVRTAVSSTGYIMSMVEIIERLGSFVRSQFDESQS